MVDELSLDGGVEGVLRRRAEVAAMQIAEGLGGADEGGAERAVAGVHRLRALKEEEARARAVVRLDERDVDAARVGDNGRDVHG